MYKMKTEEYFFMEDTVLLLRWKNKTEFFFAKYFESLLHNSSSVAETKYLTKCLYLRRLFKDRATPIQAFFIMSLLCVHYVIQR